MQQAVTYVVFFLSLMFIIVFGVEFAGHTVVNVKANEISEYAVSLAERDGGFTPDVINKVNQKLKDSNMDSKDWKMEYTQGKVQFNQTLTFTIKGKYKYNSFKLLERGIGALDASVQSTRSGVGQVYFR
ncbi:DUF4320 family protein [Bacillus thuringiensis]|uniref:DUF4320 family protein n=1 Tax=Bacillus thuringiensis TaxID=1428 RepID=UPI0001A1AD80|nr:DUF4320 family protein [Bacillus thuringiensis]EEM38405.1 Hypothetical secreted protein [Bacillus thuringiensis serovar sotto str. T04001]MEB4893690.1 DUF4320 family protein [Bacillus thuringiensis]MEC2564880.1 DUF4320 family protein [Bacillus thuringiensis]MEC2646417.1 DUF4320 family protein [Bacillus thuringiensis]MEC2727745.1 DUF4320 family protein [Bacillus thuringiensis]